MQAFFPRVDLAAHRQQVAAVVAQLKENLKHRVSCALAIVAMRDVSGVKVEIEE
jgi:hypothetical protein